MSDPSFDLGRAWSPASARAGAERVLYPSSHLLTHAVIVGMTGSGKTGLGVVMLEEAALAGIPAIAIDPKGDLGNLLLTFPEQRPDDFAPFVPEGEDPVVVAARAREGLAGSGQDGAKIARFAAAVDRTIYTPGSRTGRPLSLMPPLGPPPPGSDDEGTGERAIACASALLSLAGIDDDPLRSPEHSLVSNVLSSTWRAGRGLDLESLLRAIQSPPFERLGMMDLESVVPARDRRELAVRLNAALASPAMAGFLEGETLDVQRLLYGDGGRPRLSILSIAHLSDAERMFFVTALLGEVLAWMRAQEGSQSLRAILYMDEIAGFFPPIAQPASKAPMLMLLKQARAFGLGVVLATQNPVDLDYKGLGNAGTWMLGRLQTERDKLRVLDGLETLAVGGLDRSAIDATLSGLTKRVFFVHDVHAKAPVLMETRWALSYLRGPLSREQTRRLTLGAESPAARPTPAASPSPGRPVLPAEVPESFLVRDDVAGPRIYRPGLLCRSSVHYVDAKASIDVWVEPTMIAPLAHEGPAWSGAWVLDRPPPESRDPVADVAYAPLPSAATRTKSYAAWAKQAIAHIVKDRALTLFHAPLLGVSATPGEAREAFTARIAADARAARERESSEIDRKWDGKLEKAREKVAIAERRLADATLARDAEVLDTGVGVLGAIFGGRRSVSQAARTGARRTAARADRRARAREMVESTKSALERLEREVADARAELGARWDPARMRIEERRVAAKKTAVRIDRLELVWVPAPA